MPLKEQCFELQDNEYVYKLCPFETATQRSQNGGMETNLGYGFYLPITLNKVNN